MSTLSAHIPIRFLLCGNYSLHTTLFAGPCSTGSNPCASSGRTPPHKVLKGLFSRLIVFLGCGSPPSPNGQGSPLAVHSYPLGLSQSRGRWGRYPWILCPPQTKTGYGVIFSWLTPSRVSAVASAPIVSLQPPLCLDTDDNNASFQSSTLALFSVHGMDRKPCLPYKSHRPLAQTLGAQ